MMQLPFSEAQFFEVFERYNTDIWPIQIALYACALVIIATLPSRSPAAGALISMLLGALLVWTGLVYHGLYFSAINPAAVAFAGLFVLGGLVTFWTGVVRRQLRFDPVDGWRTGTAALLIAYALAGYPLLDYLLGHRYPSAPTFGVPCPTAIFAIGVLSLLQSPVPKAVFAVPLIWAVIGSTAAFALGIVQDLGLLVAAAVGAGVLCRAPATGGRSA